MDVKARHIHASEGTEQVYLNRSIRNVYQQYYDGTLNFRFLIKVFSRSASFGSGRLSEILFENLTACGTAMMF